MSLLRHRRERLAVRMENELLRWSRDDLLAQVRRLEAKNASLRAERDQAEAELRALRGEVA
jgi:uncharacterized coiled-coil DUF342 family protein